MALKKAKLSTLIESFNQRELRERILICLSILTVIYVVWDLTFQQGFSQEMKKLEARHKKEKSEMVTLTSEEQVLVKSLNYDPHAPKRREIIRLEEELKKSNEKLQALSSGLVPAKKLPAILYDVLGTNSKLTFVGMKTKEPIRLELTRSNTPDSTLSDQGDEKVTSTVNSKSIGIYQHSIIVEVEGGYFDLLHYLTALEQLGWRFYWESIDYTVLQYPLARAKFEVYTLSTEIGDIGA